MIYKIYASTFVLLCTTLSPETALKLVFSTVLWYNILYQMKHKGEEMKEKVTITLDSEVLNALKVIAKNEFRTVSATILTMILGYEVIQDELENQRNIKKLDAKHG